MKPQNLNNKQRINLSVFALITLIGLSMSGCVSAQVRNEAEKYLGDGKTAYEKDSYDQAITDFNKAIQANPKSAEAFYQRGKSYFAKGEVDKALADFNKAVELDPKLDSAYVGIGRVYSDKNDRNKAMQYYTKAIQLNPRNVEAYENRAREYLNNNQTDLASEDYMKVAEVIPEAANYLSRLRTREANFKFDQTIAETTKIIENGKIADTGQRAEAYKNRASAYFGKGKDYDSQALADATKAIELAPRDYDAYLVRAEVYFVQADHGKKGWNKVDYKKAYPNAIADYSKAIELAPQVSLIRGKLYQARANSYLGIGDFDKSIADFSKSILLSPFMELYLSRAEAYESKSDFDKSIADLTKALMFKENDQTYLKRGKVFLKKGDSEKAIDDASKAIELRPDEFSNYAYALRAQARLKKGDYEKAIADAAKAIELNILNVDAYKARAEAYRKMGKPALAESDEKNAVKFEKDFKDSQVN